MLAPASASATEIWLPLPLENVSGVFDAVPCGPGTVLTGRVISRGDRDRERYRRALINVGRRCAPVSVATTSKVAVPELSALAV